MDPQQRTFFGLVGNRSQRSRQQPMVTVDGQLGMTNENKEICFGKFELHFLENSAKYLTLVD
jgi:hypothetical protein